MCVESDHTQHADREDSEDGEKRSWVLSCLVGLFLSYDIIDPAPGRYLLGANGSCLVCVFLRGPGVNTFSGSAFARTEKMAENHFETIIGTLFR